MFRSYATFVDDKSDEVTAELSDAIVTSQVGLTADEVKAMLKSGDDSQVEKARGSLAGEWPDNIRGTVWYKVVDGAQEGGEVTGYQGGKARHWTVVGWEWEKERLSAD